ncbi:MAG: LCP family protein [Clostridia bacterium]|nr:LCP family protein [Clostridia bacterium]
MAKQSKNKHDKKQGSTTAKALSTLFFLALLVFSVWMTYLYGVFYVPSLPREEIPPFLQQSTDSQTGHDTAVNSPAPTDPPGTGADSAPPQTTPQPSAPDVYKRRPGVYNILCVGRDEAAQNTDVLLLCEVDAENRTVSAVQIPRDTYLDGTKINALWARYTAAARRAGASDPMANGMEALCDTLERVLCVRVDHWVLCDLQAFRECVDTLGGVTLTVPCDMDYEDPAQGLSIHLKAGTQHLDGTAAEGLVRFRAGYLRGDLGRIEVQRLLLSAVLEEARSVSALELPALIRTAAKHLRTSMSVSDLLYFTRAAQGISHSDVTFLTLPGTDCRAGGTSGTWYYVLSRQGTWEAVCTHLNVYETPVDDRLFDRDYRLTDPKSKTLLSYYKAYLTANEATAHDVREHGVSVTGTAG